MILINIFYMHITCLLLSSCEKVSEYDQQIPQSHATDKQKDLKRDSIYNIDMLFM